MKTKRIIGILLIIELVAQLLPIAVLGANFEFPDVLRKPAAYSLTLFHQNQNVIVPAYYLFMISSLLFLPITALIKTHAKSKELDASWINLFQLAGIATAVFQVIGFCRWIFLMPFLSNQYFSAEATATSKQIIEFIYDTMNRYAGMTIGEHLGFLGMGFWTIALTRVVELNKWMKVTGIIIGSLIIIATAEQFGGSYANLFGQLNFLVNTLWTLWIVIVAIRFFKAD
jgi:hypothetical protein